ncbi:hypothetical protein [Olsenella phocaeensis]|uniref:hypothetical protein n=1 Tax=Olsenella phocaeensis TaxID=1852385 RepID=UPI003A92DAA5
MLASRAGGVGPVREADWSGERATGERPVTSSDASFLRAENEDDDGYDPYSDRPAPCEPLFEADPWD